MENSPPEVKDGTVQEEPAQESAESPHGAGQSRVAGAPELREALESAMPSASAQQSGPSEAEETPFRDEPGESADSPAGEDQNTTPSAEEDPARRDAASPATADADASADASLAVVEAILFAADSPLAPAKIAQIGKLPAKAVRAAVAQLNQRYERIGAAFRIEEIAGGFQMLTLSKYRDVLERLYTSRSDSRLSQPAMETLAVIAYRQPVLRADVEAIRGVACGEVLRGLMEKQLVHIVGRAQVLGRPLLYGTTRKFLEVFGLASLEDLPKADELRAPAQKLADPTAAPAAQPAAPAAENVAAASASSATQPEGALQPRPAEDASAVASVPPPVEGQYVPEPEPSRVSSAKSQP